MTRILTSFLLIVLLSACISPKDAGLTKVRVEGDKLFLKGTFDKHTNMLVKDALAENSNITTLVFTENGGSINDSATLALGRYIRKEGLNTHIATGGSVASGGLSLFLSGVARSMGEEVKIGVHSWQHCQGHDDEIKKCTDAKDYPRNHTQHRLHKDYVAEMLGSPDLYWFSIYSSSSDSIYWLTDEDIEKFRIITSN